MRQTPSILALASAGAILFAASEARATSPEPWSDSDPTSPPTRYELGDFGVRGGAEYRANLLYINPLDLTAESNRKINVIEHRLRLDGTIDWMDKVRLTASVDAMDGVLWGDNGNFGGNPESTSGANVNSNNVNAARVCLRQTGASTVDPKSYGYSLCPADYLYVRRLYGDVSTPIGLFRVGRQAFTEGSAVALNDGNGRRNRFGFANRGNSVDRVLFATKPLEAFKPPSDRDRSEDKGAFLILAYDRNVIDEPMKLGDDLQTFITATRFLDPALGPLNDTEGRLFYAFRWDQRNDTRVNAIGGRFSTRYGHFYGGIDAAAYLGETSEVSKAFAVVTNDPVQSQTIRQLGARAVGRYDTRFWTAYLEADYASGDSDPQVGTPLTQFRFAEDNNVGLLLFKHVLAYQTARADPRDLAPRGWIRLLGIPRGIGGEDVRVLHVVEATAGPHRRPGHGTATLARRGADRGAVRRGGPGLVPRARPRPALAAHARPLRDPRLGGHAPADLRRWLRWESPLHTWNFFGKGLTDPTSRGVWSGQEVEPAACPRCVAPLASALWPGQGRLVAAPEPA